MEMKTLLLVAAVALLAGPAATVPPCRHSPTGNLDSIIDLEAEINKTVFKVFVEDVEDLADSGCKNDFFCKVQEILHDYKTQNKTQAEKQESDKVEKIRRNLHIYINCTSINCPLALQNVTKSGDSSPVPVLLGHLKKCIQLRNSSGGAPAKDKKDP